MLEPSYMVQSVLLFQQKNNLKSTGKSVPLNNQQETSQFMMHLRPFSTREGSPETTRKITQMKKNQWTMPVIKTPFLDVFWFVGFLEGNGCFTHWENGPEPCLTIGQGDPKILYKIKKY
jgi:hypothetical protein